MIKKISAFLFKGRRRHSFKRASRVYLERAISKINLENQGIAIIKNFIESIERKKLLINMSLVSFELLLLLTIFLNHSNQAVLTLVVILLIISFLLQALITLVLNYLTHYSKIFKALSITILVLNKGVRNLDATIVTLRGWYGWLARRRVEQRIVSRSEIDTFNSLLPEWQGSLEELIIASRNL